MSEAKNYPSALITTLAIFALAAALCGLIWSFYGWPWSGEVRAEETRVAGDTVIDFAGVKVVLVPCAGGEPFTGEPVAFALANEKFVFEDGRTFDCEPIGDTVRVWPVEMDAALAETAGDKSTANLYVGDSTVFMPLSYSLVKLAAAGLETANLVLVDDYGEKVIWPVSLVWDKEPTGAPACYISPGGYSYAPSGGEPSRLYPRKSISYDAAGLSGFMNELYAGARVSHVVLCPDRNTQFADIVPFFEAARAAGFTDVYVAYDPSDRFTAGKMASFGGELFYPEVVLLADGPIVLK